MELVASETGNVLTLPTEQQDEIEKTTEAHIRVPGKLLASVLDGGKSSAYAAHLLALKASKPAGWALNQHHCMKLGISARSFKTGIRMLRKCAGLQRSQPAGRKGYAVENDFIGTVRTNYVRLPLHAIGFDTKVLAFSLAVLLSPKPTKAAQAARRIGIKSPKTASKLAKASKTAGLIEIYQGPRSELWTGRSGINFADFADLGKNDPAKNDIAKNDPAHKILEEGKEYRKGSSSETENARARVLKPARTERSSFKDETTPDDDTHSLSVKDARESIKFEEIILPDWKAGSHRFPDLPETEFYGQAMDQEQFFAWINALGGLPPHLRSMAAYRQMDEIAAMLTGSLLSNGRALGCDRDNYMCLEGFEAMIGIIRAVCEEDAAYARNGRTLKTLHYVAKRLVKKTAKYDFSWSLNRPPLPRYKGAAFDNASRLCSYAFAELGRAGFPMIKDTMLSTLSVEQMADMIAKFGYDIVKSTIDAFVKREEVATIMAEGRKARRFGWFAELIQATFAERQRRDLAQANERRQVLSARRSARKGKKAAADEIPF